MKWYPHDPAAFLEGVIGLTAEERGFYITLIDLLYARDGHDVRDGLVCKAMSCRPQSWRRVKKSLISKGKVRETGGVLTANRVETTLQTAFSKGSLHLGLKARIKQKQQLKADRTITRSRVSEGGDLPHSPRAGARARAKTPLPENWHPELVGNEQFDGFCDHARAHDRQCFDWEAARRTWNRKLGGGSNGNGRRAGSVLAAFERLGEKLKAAGATDDYVPGSSGPRPLELDPKVRPIGLKLISER